MYLIMGEAGGGRGEGGRGFNIYNIYIEISHFSIYILYIENLSLRVKTKNKKTQTKTFELKAPIRHSFQYIYYIFK